LVTSAADGLTLSEAEGEALSTEAAAFAAALRDPTARSRYERLAAHAQDGSVPGDMVGALETMLELVLQTGGPAARQPLSTIYARTPRGRAQAAAARDVNRALAALRDQRLEDVRLTAGPASHSLVLQTEACRVTLELDARGARITSLEAG